MTRKPDAKPGERGTRRLEFCVAVFIASPMLALLAFLLMMPMVVIVAAVARLGDVLGVILGMALTIFLSLGLVFRLACSLLAGDWGQFFSLLPELLDWLRSLVLL